MSSETSSSMVANYPNTPDQPKEHLGIPTAEFIDDIDAFMAKQTDQTAVHPILVKFDELYNKYKFMEANLDNKSSKLSQQIPEIKSSLQMLQHLKDRKWNEESFLSRFELSDNIHVKAAIPPTDKVCLWLGANVMLEYSVEEADALLNENVAKATTNLKKVREDLNFLRDQVTTVEVNMARLHNWDVKRRQEEKKSTALK